MEAIILAGGLGTRLSSIISDIPKVMAPINNTPFLTYILDALVVKGFKHVVLATGYKACVISNFYHDSYKSIKISYSVEHTQLGTGGAIVNALKKCNSDHVHVMNGDTFFDVDSSFIERHWQKNRAPIIVCRKVDSVGRFGVIEIDSSGLITSFNEKKRCGSGIINGGYYLLPSDIFNNEKNEIFSVENDFFAKSACVLKAYGIVQDGYFIDIGVPEDFLKAQVELKKITNRIIRP